MNMFVLLLSGAMLYGPVPTAQKSTPDPSASATGQQTRLQKVDEYIAQLTQRIERTYDNRIAELHRRAEQQLRSLEQAESHALADAAVQPAWFYEGLGYLPTRGYTVKEDGRWLSNERAVQIQEQTLQRKRQIQADLARRVAALLRRKDYALNVLLLDRRDRLMNAVLNPIGRLHGVVTGIVEGTKGCLALVGRRIVQQGDTILGVTVQQIHHNGVVFAKDGRRWEQTVRQPAAPGWPAEQAPKSDSSPQSGDRDI